MQSLAKVLKEFDLYDRVMVGLQQLARNDSHLIEMIDEIEYGWKFRINDRALRGGRCSFPSQKCTYGVVEINGILLQKSMASHRLQTMLHEVAHAINWILHRWEHDSHGPKWRRVMAALDCPPHVCTQGEFTEAITRQKQERANYVYACQNCEQEFPAIRRKKRPAWAHYHAGSHGCRGALYLKIERGRRHSNPKMTPAELKAALAKLRATKTPKKLTKRSR